MKYAKDDNFFLKLVKNGRLKVEKNGLVTNTETGKVIGQRTPLVILKEGNFRYSIPTYTLVWIAFNGLVPDGLRVFRRDPNAGSGLDNLEVMTISEKNSQLNARRKDAGKTTQKRGAENHQARFTDEEVISLRLEYLEKPFVIRHRAKELGTSHPILSMALRGVSYNYLPHAVPELKKRFTKPSKPRVPRVKAEKPKITEPRVKAQKVNKPKPVVPSVNFGKTTNEDRLALLKRLGRKMGI